MCIPHFFFTGLLSVRSGDKWHSPIAYTVHSWAAADKPVPSYTVWRALQPSPPPNHFAACPSNLALLCFGSLAASQAKPAWTRPLWFPLLPRRSEPFVLHQPPPPKALPPFLLTPIFCCYWCRWDGSRGPQELRKELLLGKARGCREMVGGRNRAPRFHSSLCHYKCLRS
uniref:Uncharacterized protein n=1 Tax=Rousettus aegyptiacus TaxID=9407 RepID=A0A7J8JHC1_ROUAE|nr:hypothetical protein HJG63_010329 [Rousettus aegyptiacus]